MQSRRSIARHSFVVGFDYGFEQAH
jgi:hypothetical protein